MGLSNLDFYIQCIRIDDNKHPSMFLFTRKSLSLILLILMIIYPQGTRPDKPHYLIKKKKLLGFGFY